MKKARFFIPIFLLLLLFSFGLHSGIQLGGGYYTYGPSFHALYQDYLGDSARFRFSTSLNFLLYRYEDDLARVLDRKILSAGFGLQILPFNGFAVEASLNTGLIFDTRVESVPVDGSEFIIYPSLSLRYNFAQFMTLSLTTDLFARDNIHFGLSFGFTIGQKNLNARLRELGKAPIIVVNSPQSGSRISTLRPTVKLTVIHYGHDVARVVYSVNDGPESVYNNSRGVRLVHTGHLSTDRTRTSLDLIIPVELKENIIRITAYNKNGVKSETSVLHLTASGTAKRDGTDYAVLIATDDYDADSWSKLLNPIADATALANYLKTQYGFTVLDFLKNPTKNEILNYFTTLANRGFKPHDQLLIFIAGHGHKTTTKTGKLLDSYIVAKDSKNPVDDPTFGSYIPHSVLQRRIDNLDCKHILLMLDVCFGGLIDPSTSANSSQRGIYDDKQRDQLILETMRYTTRRYIASGGDTYVPDGYKGRHSPFMSRVLGLFNRGGSQGVLTFWDIYAAIRRANPTPVWGALSSKNQPLSDFVFQRK